MLATLNSVLDAVARQRTSIFWGRSTVRVFAPFTRQSEVRPVEQRLAGLRQPASGPQIFYSLRPLYSRLTNCKIFEVG